MERTRRRYRTRQQQADIGDPTILQSIKPIELNGRRSEVCGLRKLLVYTDFDEVVVSVVTDGGTLNIPISRRNAASLAAALTTQLVAVRTEQPPELRRRRLGRIVKR